MLYRLLSATAELYSDRPAMFFGDGDTVSFGDFQFAVDELAERLSDIGIEPQDRVVILLPNLPEFPASFFAIAKLGAAAVPINSAFQPAELKFYFAGSRPRAILTTRQLQPMCEELVGDLSLACRVVAVEGALDWAGRVPAPETADRPEFSDAVLVQYSSGSTGTPKTIVRTQQHLLNEANTFLSTVGIGHEDRILTVVPLFHAHGFANCMMASIRTGAAMVLLDVFNRQQVLSAIHTSGVTVFPGVPFMFRMLAATRANEHSSSSSLRLAFSAGAPLDEKTAQQFPEIFGTPLRQLYGSTETGAVAINLGDCDGGLWASVGKPLDGVEIRVIGDNGTDCLAGDVGEIVILSPAMTEGYGGPESVSNQSFRSGCFWTGDLGYRDDEGRIFITGRKTLFINVSGNKADPAEIESVLDQHPSVEEAVVVGITDHSRREIIKAVVVRKGDCSEEDLRQWCYERLVEYKVPRVFEFREEIPRSPLGKILRKYLAEDI